MPVGDSIINLSAKLLAIRSSVVEDASLIVDSSPNSFIDTATSILSTHGCVAIKGLVDIEDVSRTAEVYGKNIKEIVDKLGEKSNLSTDEWIAQKDLSLFSNYLELSNTNLPVVNIRSTERKDTGLIDVFNVGLFQEVSGSENRCIAAVSSEEIREIINKSSELKFETSTTNLYLSRSITNTRGLHFDTMEPMFKSFLYLTDVLNLEDGPYTYFTGSHKRSFLARFNIRLNRLLRYTGDTTDATLFRDRDATPVMAPKGTLVISCQKGAHRGWPQAVGRERLALVQAWFPKK